MRGMLCEWIKNYFLLITRTPQAIAGFLFFNIFKIYNHEKKYTVNNERAKQDGAMAPELPNGNN